MIKTVIISVLLFFVIRLMGKRQIGEMQPFEFVITMILAEVACLPLNDPAVPLYTGVIPVITLAFLDIVPTFIGRKNRRFRRFTDGSSVIVVDGRGISAKNIARLNMSVDDVVMSCRSCGCPDLALVAYAIVEPNGKFSVIPKPEKGGEDPSLPVPIAEDGKRIEENIRLFGISDSQFTDALGGCKGIKDVRYMDVRRDGTVYVSPASTPCYTKKIRLGRRSADPCAS